MQQDSSDRRTYLALGLLDFLAYFVPGVIALFFVFVVGEVFNLRIEILINYINNLGGDKYVRGAIWTVMLLVVPYVIGQLIFPPGYTLAAKLFPAKPIKENNPLAKRCSTLEAGRFCEPESMEFPDCLLRCFRNSTAAFNDLMITRFRTLSRFCRSMLLPSLLLSSSLILIAVHEFSQGYRKGGFAAIIATVLVGMGFVGFGTRHRRYETRWRTGVCVASWESSEFQRKRGQPLKKDKNELP
ncbi:MAG: hypothetical protein ACFFCW_44920 [Candidatus Hodarchaeota archaeon]